MGNLKATVEFAKNCGAKGVELLRFNPLGVSKYESFGKKGKVFANEPQEKSEIEKLVKELNEFLREENFVYCLF